VLEPLVARVLEPTPDLDAHRVDADLSCKEFGHSLRVRCEGRVETVVLVVVFLVARVDGPTVNRLTADCRVEHDDDRSGRWAARPGERACAHENGASEGLRQTSSASLAGVACHHAGLESDRWNRALKSACRFTERSRAR
jgi:hypothetical protein